MCAKLLVGQFNFDRFVCFDFAQHDGHPERSRRIQLIRTKLVDHYVVLSNQDVTLLQDISARSRELSESQILFPLSSQAFREIAVDVYAQEPVSVQERTIRRSVFD